MQREVEHRRDNFHTHRNLLFVSSSNTVALCARLKMDTATVGKTRHDSDPNEPGECNASPKTRPATLHTHSQPACWIGLTRKQKDTFKPTVDSGFLGIYYKTET